MTSLTEENALLERALANPEMAPFAMFNIELPSGGDLWSITSNELDAATQARDERIAEVVAHQQRVAIYANRVVDGLPLREGDDTSPAIPEDELEPAPLDEWTRFWGGESPTQRQARYRGDE